MPDIFSQIPPGVNPSEYARNIQSMYPDIYRRMMPYIENAAVGIGSYQNLTEADIARIAENTVRNSGITSDAYHGHNEGSLSDIARILLLAVLFNRFYDPIHVPYPGCPNPMQPCDGYTYPAYPYPIYPYPSVLPFIPFHHGFRHHHGPGRPHMGHRHPMMGRGFHRGRR